jgi:predicted amidohydrolase YtcJ
MQWGDSKFLSSAAKVYFLVALGGLWLAGQSVQAQAPDLILHHGKILTVDNSFSTAEAVAVTGNKISAVGRNEDLLKMAGPKTQSIDLKGRTVTPGLIDTHTHIYSYAEAAYGDQVGPEKIKRYPVDWRGVTSKDDVLNQIRGLMDKYKFKPGEWIYFENSVSFISSGTVELAKIMMDDLNQAELDKVTPRNPVALSVGIPDFNGFLVNKTALNILMKEHGGFLKKYGRFWIGKDGLPDGHFEPPGSRLVFDYVPQPNPEEIAGIYKKYNDEWTAAGVTTASTRLPKYAVKTYQLLRSRGELNIRMGYGQEWTFGSGEAQDLSKDLKKFKNTAGSGDDYVWITSLAPTEVDGATTRACTNQKRGTAYGAIDSYWPTGQCQTDAEFKGAAGHAAPISGAYFREWIMESGKDGIRFANTHVAGDRSVANILDMMETIQKQGGTNATKNWAMDHCFLVNPADLPKAARLNATFSCAPKYMETAAGVANSYGEQVANTYIDPLKSMLKAGVKLVFESDRDTYEWRDIQLMLTRKDRKGKVWGPQEALTKEEALRAITRSAADYVLKGDKIGSLEPGKLADLLVLDKDYMTTPNEEVNTIQPQLTMVDGRIAYLHPNFAREYNLNPQGAVIATYQELFAKRTNKGRGRTDF